MAIWFPRRIVLVRLRHDGRSEPAISLFWLRDLDKEDAPM
jgi:hypothetical protein